jgi:hypothetical protein
VGVSWSAGRLHPARAAAIITVEVRYSIVRKTVRFIEGFRIYPDFIADSISICDQEGDYGAEIAFVFIRSGLTLSWLELLSIAGRGHAGAAKLFAHTSGIQVRYLRLSGQFSNHSSHTDAACVSEPCLPVSDRATCGHYIMGEFVQAAVFGMV